MFYAHFADFLFFNDKNFDDIYSRVDIEKKSFVRHHRYSMKNFPGNFVSREKKIT